MPFRSKAQARKFFAMESRGELPKGEAEKWATETPDIGKLPERVGDSYGIRPRKKGGKTREKLHELKLQGK